MQSKHRKTQLRSVCLKNDHGYIPFVVIIIRSFPYSRLITGFVTRVARRIPHVEKELGALPEHLSSHLVLVGFVLLDLYFSV
jgi:hypothetical protein